MNHHSPHSKQPPDSAAKLTQALTLHQQDQLDQAQALYKDILQSEPEHFDALHLLACLLAKQKNAPLALELFNRALSVNPNSVPVLNNRGLTLFGLRRYEEALASYDQALHIKPHAVDILSNRGNALLELGRAQEALASYDRALHIQPNFITARCNRALALMELERCEEALRSYDHVLQLHPDYLNALINRGNALRELRRPEEALVSYDRALQVNPHSVEALSKRSFTLFELKRFEQALDSCDQALQIRPDYAEALNNRGNALFELQRFDEALASYERALSIDPDYVEALSNRGNVLCELKRAQEALSSYERALQVDPDYAIAHWNESLCRLLLGDFEKGWQKYEWRWQQEPLPATPRRFAQPLWLGKETLAGKTILLHAEQGLGDTLQFCRYTPLVVAQGAKVVLEVQPTLKQLCKTVAGVHTLIAAGEALPSFDLHIPLMSLPLALKTRLDSIPVQAPYLSSEPAQVAKWHALLGQKKQLRVGLAWSGSSTHKNDCKRSLPIALLTDLTHVPCEFICLQKEFRSEEERLGFERAKVRIVSERLKDFSDTAALIDILDLVITIDTSVAHLAGSMGKPVWILLPYVPDFRWLLEREDSPWYPSARLYRQEKAGAWDQVLERVVANLRRSDEHCNTADA